MIYEYVKAVSTDRLTEEIRLSSISVALDYITTNGDNVKIYFKANLSSAEVTVLDGVIAAHINTPLPENTAQQVELQDLPEPKPFAQPLYRTKRNATSNLMTVTVGGNNTIDFTLPSERYVTGGAIIVKNAQLGDYITASVYDGNSVIPEAYRATLCENWPVVAEYIEKEWVKIGNGDYSFHEINTYPLNAKISQGLILRVTYHAVNSGLDRIVAINYNLTKKL